MLLVDHDQPEVPRSARTPPTGADADPRVARAQTAPLVAALAVRRPEWSRATPSPNRDANRADGLRRERDLGNQHDRAAPAGSRAASAAARYTSVFPEPVTPWRRSSAARFGRWRSAIVPSAVDCCRVERRLLDVGAHRDDRGPASALASSRSSTRPRASSLRRRRDRLCAGAHRLGERARSHRPVADARAIDGALARRRAARLVQGARPRAVSSRQRSLGGRGSRPRALETRGEHQARGRAPESSSTRAPPRARGGRAPAWRPPPAPRCGSARRSAGSSLDSASPTTTPSDAAGARRGPAGPSRPPRRRAAPGAVVERAAQGAGGGEGLDLGDRHVRPR